MDNINKESQTYFQEEICQMEIMLKGVLNTGYREYLNMKLKCYEYVLNLLRKEELQCKESMN